MSVSASSAQMMASRYWKTRVRLLAVSSEVRFFRSVMTLLLKGWKTHLANRSCPLGNSTKAFAMCVRLDSVFRGDMSMVMLLTVQMRKTEVPQVRMMAKVAVNLALVLFSILSANLNKVRLLTSAVVALVDGASKLAWMMRAVTRTPMSGSLQAMMRNSASSPLMMSTSAKTRMATWFKANTRLRATS